jgi:F420-non-reducing hydrogenase iron-sulfur subunit
LRDGADGVLIGGCHPGDCHYVSGNYKTRRRIYVLQKILPELGIEPGRVRLEWVSAAEGARFAQVVSEFTQEIRALGPLPVNRDPLFVIREPLSVNRSSLAGESDGAQDP